MVKTTVKLLIDPQNNSLAYSKNFRIFSTAEPVTGIVEFTDYLEDIDITSPGALDLSLLVRKIRYSRNKLDWSLWYQVEPGNIGDAATIVLDAGDPFYFEVKYEYDDGTQNAMPALLTINEIKLRFRQVGQTQNVFTPRTVSTVEQNISIIANRDPSFRPYEVDPAISMFQDLSYFANQQFGHQVVYFRTVPESDSGDYVFKEWTLYKNIDRKCIKVLVPGNNFPDQAPKFTDFGMDFQLPFEIEIDHKYYQSIFGYGSEPRKRDFLYFPLLNRMFEIQGSYLHKGFMMAPTYWKVQLKKYNPNIDMLLMDTSRTFLDNVIQSAEQLFGERVEEDIKDAAMPAQYQKITTTFDASRKALHPDIKQKPLKYTFNFAPLIENYYDLGGIAASEISFKLTQTSPGEKTDQYAATLPGIDNPNSTNQVIIANEHSDMFKTWRNNGLITNDKNFKNTSTLNCRVRGPFDHIPNHQGQSEEGRYVRVEAYRDITYRDQRDVLIDTVAGEDFARFKVRENAVIYNATPAFDTTDNKNLSFTCLFNVPVGASAINFIDGFDSLTQTGIKITALFLKYSNTLPEGDLVITLTVNSQVKTYTINNFSSGNWHALVISISNEFNQCGAYVYKIVDDPADLINHSGFTPILSSTSSFTQSQFNLAQNYILPNSLLWISNIRLFNTMLREEDHDFILSQQYLKDESMLILIDNCKPQIDLPYVSKNR
jgi:hypothetical protein